MLSGLLLLAVALGTVPATAASVIYFANFESNSTAGFSGSTTITQAPSGAKFLGPLSNGGIANLTLTDVGKYPFITLSFDLYTLYSLDGDSWSIANGVVGHPDYFTVKVNGSTTLFEYTFSNGGGSTQSYGGAGSPAGTGSDPSLAGQLQYPYYDQWLPGPGDYTYHISLNLFLKGKDGLLIQGKDTLVFSFIGNSGQGWPDEGFGIDNVRVTATPLPGALPLFATGLGVLGLLGWRRKRKVGRSVGP
jgi:hypothetical protein